MPPKINLQVAALSIICGNSKTKKNLKSLSLCIGYGMQIKIKEIDKRMDGYGQFKYYVDIR